MALLRKLPVTSPIVTNCWPLLPPARVVTLDRAAFFFGYDFHLGADGPRLIEINTNAGGALLNLYLAAAQQACCAEVVSFFGGNTDFADIEEVLIEMFRAEIRFQRPNETLKTVAIVDNDPTKQFLHPEFFAVSVPL